MKTVNPYPLGSEVYYFDPVIKGDLEIKKSIVIGAFVHKSKGELYYTLLDHAVEAYAVRLTKKGAEEQRDVFDAIRKELLKQEEKHQERMETLWGNDAFPEFGIDNLPTEGELNGDVEGTDTSEVHE